MTLFIIYPIFLFSCASQRARTPTVLIARHSPPSRSKTINSPQSRASPNFVAVFDVNNRLLTGTPDTWTRDSCGRGYSVKFFFDTLDHAHLREFLQLRVRDGVLKRLIGKWLKAGVMESGSVSYPDAGSPQGGVISPLLANVFLHYVLDVWLRQEVQPRLRGRPT